MDKPIVPTLPARSRSGIYLRHSADRSRTRPDRDIGERLKLPDSFMARHFILEAVTYHSANILGDEVDG